MPVAMQEPKSKHRCYGKRSFINRTSSSKNNLQIISTSSILTPDILRCKTFEILKSAENRAISMALVITNIGDLTSKTSSLADSSQLYQTFRASNLFGSYNINTDAIKLKKFFNVDKISLVVNTAITCGLIINELISKRFKVCI